MKERILLSKASFLLVSILFCKSSAEGLQDRFILNLQVRKFQAAHISENMPYLAVAETRCVQSATLDKTARSRKHGRVKCPPPKFDEYTPLP